jgi:meckelin
VTQSDYDAIISDLPGQQLISARSLTFRDVISSDGSAKLSTSDPVESDLFGRYLVEGAVGCTFNQQPESCQLLANLCVLTMYDAGSGACTLFDALVAALPAKASTQYPDDGWRNGLPWLSYEQDVKTLLQTTLKSQKFDLTVGFYDDETAGRS